MSREANKAAIAVATTWAAVIIVMKDAGLMGKMIPILGGGAAGCIAP